MFLSDISNLLAIKGPSKKKIEKKMKAVFFHRLKLLPQCLSSLLFVD